SSSSTVMAAAEACSSMVEGNSAAEDPTGLAFRFGNTTVRVASAGVCSDVDGCSSGNPFSVTIVCFFGVFSLFTSAFRIARLRARSACQADQRSAALDTKRNRGLKNATAPVNENFVERKSETRNEDASTTRDPVRLNDV